MRPSLAIFAPALVALELASIAPSKSLASGFLRVAAARAAGGLTDDALEG
jgi:hypothetical protein